MYDIQTLKNGLTLITVPLPYLDSVTTLVAVGAGSRYETKKTNGISHFLEHMFFKGSKKYPSAEMIANIVDSIGAVNNAATDKEITFYWIKSAAKHLELSCDLLSSMLKESLLKKEEIDREKGVIIEEIRMYLDSPSRYVFDLYEELQFGDQPLGWQVAGDEKTVNSIKRQDFLDYTDSLYKAGNMALVFAGKIPPDVIKIATDYFGDLQAGSFTSYEPYQESDQDKPRVHIFNKKTDQANIILGVKGYSRQDPKRFAARLLGMILGEGMSSRLFIEVRERRGLAYHVSSFHNSYLDTGAFCVYGGLKLEKLKEGIEIIRQELEKATRVEVTDAELKKVKEMERGRLALRSESTNFLAEHFGTEYVLDRKLESFDEYLQKIDAVTAADIKDVAEELIHSNLYNLEIIAPLKDPTPFQKLLTN